MSIFGNLDAQTLAEINDDPFWVKPDTYKAICTEAVSKESENGGIQLVITWTIDEPANEFDKKDLKEYFGLFPHRKSWDEYTSDEKTATKWLKRRLRRGFDLSESELATVNFSDLVGKEAFITLVERKGKEGTKNEGKTFVNINDAVCKRIFDEEKKESASVAQSVGLL